jgi:hypothetical protein
MKLEDISSTLDAAFTQHKDVYEILRRPSKEILLTVNLKAVSGHPLSSTADTSKDWPLNATALTHKSRPLHSPMALVSSF